MSPGDEVILRRDGHELRPYSELKALVYNGAPVDGWRARCMALAIADLPLFALFAAAV